MMMIKCYDFISPGKIAGLCSFNFWTAFAALGSAALKNTMGGGNDAAGAVPGYTAADAEQTDSSVTSITGAQTSGQSGVVETGITVLMIAGAIVGVFILARS